MSGTGPMRRAMEKLDQAAEAAPTTEEAFGEHRDRADCASADSERADAPRSDQSSDAEGSDEDVEPTDEED